MNLVRRFAEVLVPALLVLATAAFFALSWGYVRLCEKL